LGKLRVFSGKQVCDILARHGFLEVRQRGSHIIMQKQFPDTTLTVPVPNHAELRKARCNPSSASAALSEASSSDVGWYPRGHKSVPTLLGYRVSSETAHFLLKQLEQLTYRQLCLIALVGKKESINVESLRRPEHSDPELEALKREEMDLHSNDLGTKGLISGAGSWGDKLSSLGKVMYNLAGLEEISEADMSALETIIESLRHNNLNQSAPG
jgi:predicted RNA binding protein YcfA (HicA-like mRNA interferase family)